MQLIPSLNRRLEKGPRASGMIRYRWEEGLPFLDDTYGGTCLPQVYCAPVFSQSPGLEVFFTDDVIFGKNKKGLLQLVVLLDGVTEIEPIRKAISNLGLLTDSYVLPEEATFLVQKVDVQASPSLDEGDIFRIATSEEFASCQRLCQGRPPPQYYDMYHIHRSFRGKCFVLVRPDFLVYAACDSAEQLRAICTDIRQTIGV